VISIYQVCPSTTNAIGHTAWHQQRRALDLANRHIHPRKAFIQDLEKVIQELQSKNHALIIGGDWNECDHHSNSGILKLCTTYDLVDPWRAQYPQHPEVATFEFGIHRIDSVIMSRSIANSVRHIGYSPVGYLLNTDHRSLVLEFHTEQLFGNNLEALPSIISRGARSKDKASVTSFIEVMHEHLVSNNAFQRAKELKESDLPIPEQIALIENLDRLLGQAGDSGEKKCRRRRPQWFSVAAVQQRLELSYLTHYHRGLKCGKNRQSSTAQKLATIQKPQSLSLCPSEVAELIKDKQTALQKTCTQSTHTRQTMLTDMAASLDAIHDAAKASVVKRIRNHEASASIWRTLSHFSSGGSTHQQLDRLEIPTSWPERNTTVQSITDLEDPKSATSWRTVTDPYDIEHYLMLRNRMHFGQAQGTPFTIPPLSDHLDWTASMPAADEILQGSYVPSEELSEMCKQVLQECKSSAALDHVPAELTLEEFTAKIQSWREATTTSPSGRHLGRYKALFGTSIYLLEPDDNGNGPFEQFLVKQKEIAALIVQIINFCIQHGHVLSRWTQIVNTMIFKDEGNYRIHRLRVIHIYEADFNLLLAVKWRALLKFADRAGLINKGQFGGRPGHEATSLALLEELRIDISYLTRRILITFDNDAASCYDRIIAAFAALINRKYGLHRQIVVVHGKTLQEARYKLRTAVGISATEYSHSTQFPLYGSGQGSGNSPALWLFISATLFDVHD
jgi:hypothetical protein